MKLFSWIAGVAFVLAALYFLRYSVEHGWLSPTVRATIGILTGTTLLVVCELRVARNYKFTANALHGAGVAILYATLFAIHALWHLMPAAAVFALMLIVTAIAVMLSIRRDSVFIALLGLLGGFATPALLSTGENRPVGLFAYLLLLNVGLAWVAFRKRWPALTIVSLVFTAIYQWAWIGKYLTASQLPLAVGIFIVFALVAAVTLFTNRGDADAKQKLFDRTAIAAAALPLLFGVFMAAVPAYGARYNVLFTFLLFVAGGLAAIARWRGPRWLRHLGGGATLLVFAIWCAVSYAHGAWPAVLAWIAAFVLLHLAADWNDASTAAFAAPLLFFTFPALIALENATRSPAALFATLFALLACVAAYAIRSGRGALYFLAALFAVVAEAAWSARFLTADRLLTALALYLVFALFFIGVPALARRLGKALTPADAAPSLLILAISILFFIAGGAVADAALWGLALLLAILNIGALLEARTARMPLASAFAMVLSWIVIAVWWASAAVAVQLIPALFVVGGFALLIVIGNVWAARQPDTSEHFEHSTFLGLAGHLFLMFVAGQTSLAVPPWPLLAVLGVLDLALGVASLYLRRTAMMTAALIASQVVLMIFGSNAATAPWPQVALASAVAVAALGMLWLRFRREYATAAFTALFAGQLVTMIVAGSATVAPFAALTATNVAFVIGILAVCWISERHAPATFAAVTSAAGMLVALRDASVPQVITIASAIYAPFLAYPLRLGRRARQSIHPYLAAVLASLPFFGAMYYAMEEKSLDWMIGVLPLAQAALMLLLVKRLLQIEPPGERTLSRLALVSAAALAFMTAAVPLQLSKEWITIAWALEGAALVWLFRRIPHRGLLLWAAALLATVFVRLTFNPAVFEYHARSGIAVLNWYLYTYVVSAAAMFVAAWLLPRDERERTTWAVPALSSCATILLFLVVNIEIADYFSTGPHLTFNFFSASLGQDLTYTMGWALFAIGMLVTGIAMRVRAARVAALILLLVTILKCFLHDLARLGGLYRVGSLLGLALSLVVVGVLLQRFVMIRDASAADAEPVGAPPAEETT